MVELGGSVCAFVFLVTKYDCFLLGNGKDAQPKSRTVSESLFKRPTRSIVLDKAYATIISASNPRNKHRLGRYFCLVGIVIVYKFLSLCIVM